MIPQLLLYKILQLFMMMLFGFVLVKANIIKGKDSVILSKLSLYLFMPSVIINAFNIEINGDVVYGLVFAFVVAILIHIVFLILDVILKRVFKAKSIERASVMYSNAGNLIVPIVTFVLGEQWVIYSCAYLIVQLVFLWTHGVRLFSGDEKLNIRKILLNINVIAVFIGFIIMIFGLKLPDFAGDIFSSFGNMLAPTGMIIAGMLAAETDFKKMLKNKRLYFVLVARLVIYPLLIMLMLKGILNVVNIKNAHDIMLVSFFASMTPAASTVMQFAQLYGEDAEYSVIINVVTTAVCILTMPLMVSLF